MTKKRSLARLDALLKRLGLQLKRAKSNNKPIKKKCTDTTEIKFNCELEPIEGFKMLKSDRCSCPELIWYKTEQKFRIEPDNSCVIIAGNTNFAQFNIHDFINIFGLRWRTMVLSVPVRKLSPSSVLGNIQFSCLNSQKHT